MLQVTPIVFVADDDLCVRESTQLLIRCEGWQPETFASAQEFLDHPRTPVPSCLILDISLPGLTGLDLQRLLAVDPTDMPVIFITGHGGCTHEGPSHQGRGSAAGSRVKAH